jgi:hypothetical protein
MRKLASLVVTCLDDLFELCREMIVDPEISAEIPARKLGEVQPVMQDWPQHPIGKAAVVFFKALFERSVTTCSIFLCRIDLVSSSFPTATLPLQPSQIPPLFWSAGRNATSSPPARLGPSPGTETRLETTTSRAKSDPPPLRPPPSISDGRFVACSG